MRVQVDIHLQKEPVPEKTVYWYVLREWERPGFTEIWRAGLPMVYRMGEFDYTAATHFTDMTEEIQFFCFGLFSQTYYGMSYRQLTREQYDVLVAKTTAVYSGARAFNNRHGMNQFRNYITRKKGDQHLGMPDPAIETIWTGGASGEGVVMINAKRQAVLKVRYFDAREPFPDPDAIDPYTDPRVFFATNITSKRIDTGGFGVTPFPQQLGGLKSDVPVPIIARKDIFYPIEYLLPYRFTGVKISPYNPPRS